MEENKTELISKHLIGKKIVKVEYLPEEYMEDFMWKKRPITIHLEDGTIITPQSDNQGNDGGTILTSIEEIGTIPTI